MQNKYVLNIGQGLIALLFSMLIAGCGSITIVRPAGQNGQRAEAQIPVIAEARWQQTANLQFSVDTQDRTAEFSVNGNSATHALNLEPGPHRFEVAGDVSCSYCSGGINHQSTVVDFDAKGQLIANSSNLTLAVGETIYFSVGRTPVPHTEFTVRTSPLDPDGIIIVGNANFPGVASDSAYSTFGAASSVPIMIKGLRAGNCQVQITSQYYSPVTVNVTVTSAPPPPPVADFVLNARDITAAHGGQTTLMVNVVRNAQMHDSVSLSTSNMPAGITIASFQPPSVSATQTTANANVTVSSSVANGPYQITVQGVGAGLTKTTSTTLRVFDVDPQAPQMTTDCGCTATGDWVEPAGLINTATSPDQSVTLTTSQNGNSATLALNRQGPICNRAIGPVDLTSSTAWGFSPHSKYFVVAGYIGNVVSLDFYDLADCNAAPYKVTLTGYQAPAEGAFAGWGFGPSHDDSRFSIEAVNSQMQVEFFLVNVPAKRSQSVATPPAADEPHGTFSPCGDLYGIKDVTNFPAARIVFTLFRTRDFTSVPTTGNASVEITTIYRDADLNTNDHWHRLKRSLVSQTPGQYDLESSWPSILANGATAACN